MKGPFQLKILVCGKTLPVYFISLFSFTLLHNLLISCGQLLRDYEWNGA